MPTKKELEEKVAKLEQQKKKQLDYQNEYKRKKYKRAEVCLKLEEYDELVSLYGEGFNLSGYIRNLIKADVESKSAN